MTDELSTLTYPDSYNGVLMATAELGFTMASDVKTCSLLRTLAALKPDGNILELGTGTGLATAWILNGLSEDAVLTTIDNDATCLEIARKYLGHDPRLNIVLTDGAEWIQANRNEQFDFIFADTWHGKYLMIDEVLDMLQPGGIYIIDDMIPQPNWPDGHQQKVDNLIKYLEHREDFFLTKQQWASGIIIAVKKM